MKAFGLFALVALVLVPSLSHATSLTECQDKVAISKAANARVKYYNGVYEQALADYNTEIANESAAVQAEYERLLAQANQEISDEWASLDARVRAAAQGVDDEASLAPIYRRILEETQTRTDEIRACYTEKASHVADGYGQAAFARVNAAYDDAISAHQEAVIAYNNAVAACPVQN